VSTRVLKPQHAVLWAAFFNFIAAFFFETRVATTIGKGVVDPGAITLTVVAAGLFGAIVWDLITWWLGLPSSSSHALIGGLAAETSGATTIIGASLLGIPVSTTHTITGAIVGVGATHRLTAVRWGVAGTIVWAWILTIPLSALIAAAAYALLE